MDRGEVTCILFDLFAAFDTVDHSILLDHPSSQFFGFDGISLNWSSLISHLVLRVSINDSISVFSTLSRSVPQRSELGPLFFFTIDTTPLGSMISKIIYSYTLYHLYADDSQLYTLSLQQILFYLLKHHFHWHSFGDKFEFFSNFTMTSSLRWIVEVIYILFDLFAAFDTVEVSPQSIKNWISCYWHKTTMSQICWSYKLISQQWYHLSQFLCSLSALSALLSRYGLCCADGTLNPIHSLIHSMLTILVPSLTVTCMPLIKSTLYLNLVIFTFVIIFLLL